MRRPLVTCLLFALFLFSRPSASVKADAFSPGAFPRDLAGWRADGEPETYDRKTVYDYMDGGAEIYLEYGMRALFVQRYTRKGEQPVTFDLFEMESPGGAFGAFTFEREDAEAAVGQGSEYGGGLLRFWQGRHFGFVQAEVETPSSKEAILALGKAVAGLLGPPAPEPSLANALPREGLRPLTVRYVLSPLLLQTREPLMEGNPLGLPSRCEAVVARYGSKGARERVIVTRCPSASSAKESVGALVNAEFPTGTRAGRPYQEKGTWSVAEAVGVFGVVVLDAPTEASAMARLQDVRRNLREVAR